jgi:hypothetical protein
MLSELWRPLAVFGTFLVIVIVVVILLFTGGGSDDEPYVTPKVDTPKATVPAEELDADAKPRDPDAEAVAGKELEVGDCLSNATRTTSLVTNFDKIDCDKAHDGEVFTIIKLRDAKKYPGKKTVSTRGQRGCRARLRRQATAKAFRDPQLGYKFVYPTQQSWAQDDREISCLVTFKKSRKTRLAQRPAAS